MNHVDGGEDEHLVSLLRSPSAEDERLVEDVLGRQLHVLEDRLRCRVCFEIFCQPVQSIRCGHTFCSLCVRKYLIYKQQCPDCYDVLHDVDLKPNRAVREVVDVLVSVFMPKVLEVLRVVNAKHPHVFLRTEEEDSNPPPSTSTPNNSSSPATPTRPLHPSPGPSGKSTTLVPEVRASVRCPVCLVSVPEKNVNVHLDRCLQERDKPRPLQKAKKNSMKPMQKLVYHLVKEPSLRKMLRDAGLDSRGDKKTLIARHQKFAVLWNAQCDKEHPMSRMEIVMQVQREEQMERKEAAESAAKKSHHLKFDRNSSPKEIDEKQKRYLRENRDQFKQLVEDAKRAKASGNLSGKTIPMKRISPETKENMDDIIGLDKGSEPGNETSHSLSASSSSVSSLTAFVADACLTSPNKRTHSTEIAGSPTTKPDDPFSSKKIASVSLASQSSPVGASSSVTKKSKISCPSCLQWVPEAHINSHLDRCLEEVEGPSHAARSRRSKLRVDPNRIVDSDEELIIDESDDDHNDVEAMEVVAEIHGNDDTSRGMRRGRSRMPL